MVANFWKLPCKIKYYNSSLEFEQYDNISFTTKYSNNPFVFEYRSGIVTVQIRTLINLTVNTTIKLVENIPQKYLPVINHGIDIINVNKTCMRVTLSPSGGCMDICCYGTNEVFNTMIMFSYPVA